ncbi:MAG TPA: LAGLIDADG family homing endonuclease [archaeon]|nr:LAGLIDADG family homing endonuclease [archaeon]
MEKISGIDLTPENLGLLKEIIEIRKKGNFQTMQKRIGSERLKKFLKTLYPKYNITEIEKITGVSDSTLQHWFNRLDISFVRNHISNIATAGAENNITIHEKNGNIYKKNIIEITPELAYIIGFTLGDGSVQKFQVEVFNKDKELREPLLNFMQKYGAVTQEERPNGLWRLRLSDVLIADLIKNQEGIRKDTIEYILKKDELAKKFIAAFWDAEGSVLKQENYIHVYLYNSNKYLIDRIKEYLESKGIESSILSMDGRGRKYFYNGKPIIAKKIIFRLSIPKKHLTKWINEIGIHLLHSKKSKTVQKTREELK